ncbi:hypothetical protein A1F94_011755 [Pyrenophora tritici-repentis]|nr:hypothetical protein A1F94_011755 [Pyrenophora tritici-repentis]KAI0575532.1 hypothetical protein Alg215_07959 [Pyrenophora tritici-repentis]KAI0583058.1 hypothetical protein Alg130_05869 [Pyrenophora tritici-repentis]KAI0611810.1 hypothetical protein TUN205_03939 [Pyrenophora tritici-repentis]PZD02144.1 hypothetical protein A1F95_01938 [Pyrenophora tritici-repentis]
MVPQIPATTANPIATAAAEKQEPKKPITTVLFALPKTTYEEANGAEGTDDTLAYLKVQQELLRYLGTKAADALSARQAYKWTENISPNKHPRARDALRLCYYMRSQTFDTYADIKNGFINLYVVNQVTNLRGSDKDMLYWRQSISTNEIIQRGPPAGRASTGVLQGNAAVIELMSRVHRFADLPDPHEPAQNSLTMHIARAEVNLHRLLASEPYDADAVAAALMRMEELNQQLHTE